jgi:hypothetical protein
MDAMIGRCRKDDNDITPVEALLEQAIREKLTEYGYELTPAAKTDGYVLTAPDGTTTWLEFAVSEQPITEPPIGTVVEAYYEGTMRRGAVIVRGPGYFSFRFQYKNGLESSAVVTDSAYRVIEKSR